MDRRVFLGSVACGVVSVSLAAAQAPPRANPPRRVLWLNVGRSDPPDEVKQYEDALAHLGWIVGQNVLIDRRDVRSEDLSSTVQEFVNAKVDLIVTGGTAATLAAKRATSAVPILMLVGTDPVASGLVASLARPGGNVTGYAAFSAELRVKRVSLIRECLPGIRRIGELEASDNPFFRIEHNRILEAYQSRGIEPIFVDTARFVRFDDMLAEVVRRRAQALNIVHDAIHETWIPQLFGAAIAASLPAIVDEPRLLEAGALLSYDHDFREVFPKSAVFVDRLLRGTKPADLAVEQPTTFVLGINLKTASTLGITIPQALIHRADILIQ
jgi:putative ABC transport system substrate-binding protein